MLQGPWMLSGLEVLIMILLYALTLPSSMSLVHKHRKYHFSYRTSLEDVVGFSLARALLLSFAYAWGAKRHQHRWARHLLDARWCIRLVGRPTTNQVPRLSRSCKGGVYLIYYEVLQLLLQCMRF
jgi:hypothetical protein